MLIRTIWISFFSLPLFHFPWWLSTNLKYSFLSSHHATTRTWQLAEMELDAARPKTRSDCNADSNMADADLNITLIKVRPSKENQNLWDVRLLREGRAQQRERIGIKEGNHQKLVHKQRLNAMWQFGNSGRDSCSNHRRYCNNIRRHVGSEYRT